MSLIDMLSDENVWQQFYEYKTSLISNKSFIKELGTFISGREYISVCTDIKNGTPFPLPQKSVINKTHSQKKRVVYMYPKKENTVLKLLTYLILRKYDCLFSDNLYSFRPGRTAKDAIFRLTKSSSIRNMFSYKADISNYFNSIPLDLFLPKLKTALADDEELFGFLNNLLCEPFVLENGNPVKEEKGIMAGTPLSSFYANLFLMELDREFEKMGITYARYSDDIIVFADSKEKILHYADIIRSSLHDMRLNINPEKEFLSSPEDGWTFLGFIHKDRITDIAPVTVDKIKSKMRRKSRALARWRKRNETSGEKAARAFIRVFNRKLFESPEYNELSWSYWFFPVINTSESLNIIDRYAQDCIRFLISGVHRKSRFNVRYEDMKKLGYKSLVHEYYKVRQNKNDKK